uniref:CAP10 domain-containing protein n=1 Tax=Parastrongyloides trichosuri TaxID=131310 RepID=A0A0N4ZJZ8_PARTI
MNIFVTFVMLFLNIENIKSSEIEIKTRYSSLVNKYIPTFWKPNKLSKLNCERILNNDLKYIYSNNNKRTRITRNETSGAFSTRCYDIRRRGYYPDEPLTVEEKEFPLAYAINIYEDYLKLEQFFLITYAPQNHYCFGIDIKSDEVFKRKVKNLASCFSNVYIIDKELSLNHSGVNGNLYNYECMKILNDKNYKYLFLLQNDDVPLKTNHELVQILKIYNGTIDMNIGDPISSQPIVLNSTQSFKFKDLEIFKSVSSRRKYRLLQERNISIQKGLPQASIPKETVDYLINEINIVPLLNKLNAPIKCSDELLWPTIFTNPFLQVPGWQHNYCSSKSTIFSKYYMTRKTIFKTEKNCPSGRYRHGICLFGIEMLSSMKEWPQFFGNKMRYDFDAGAINCWFEYIYNKKFFSPLQAIDASIYQDIPLIKYQKLKREINDHVKICNIITNSLV